MILRPFQPGTTYSVGDYVEDPEDGKVYQVVSPEYGPDVDVDVAVGTLTPGRDGERFVFVPPHLLPDR